MSTIRGCLSVILLILVSGCSGDGGGALDLDGTWLTDLHTESVYATGERTTSDTPGYELVIDQSGQSVLFAGMLGHVTMERVGFGSERFGTVAEDGDWPRGWWRVGSDGWAERDEACLTVHIEIWDGGGTLVFGVESKHHFTNFVKLKEPQGLRWAS